ncbi:MAG: regulatory protein GemA [Methylobacter sp.]|nr:regulatory protein GemA [Methylobacter sp.]MDP2169654.1 regulatory protein GemA [Rhodocyclaceae bacterium]MDP2429033.1 regulatory protein GemA [Methylobacter sp.]MDP3056534.1 regulatory protein GemA [Methylobacter sp.]MDP3362023.1 regulatory protein GemA [Methylobacter sp.]
MNELTHKQQLAKIHIAKKQLGLDDDTYRALLMQLAGVNSAKDLTSAGRASVLEHLKKVGFKGSKVYKGRPHNAGTKAANAKQLGKIEALLADAGRPWAYALALAKRMYKKDALEFCDGRELAGIIAALAKDAAKRGGDDAA